MDEQQPDKPRFGRVRRAAGLAWKVARPPVGDLRQIGDVGRATAALVRSVHAKGRHESFFEALDRQGLTLADADERGRQIRRMGHIYAGTAAVALLLIAGSPFSSVPLAQFLGAFAVMVMSGAKALVSYFRVGQIHDRELYGFVSWLRGKREAYADDTNAGAAPPAAHQDEGAP